MSDLYIEARLQAIKDIASASCVDKKDADNIASFCDEIYSAIPNLDKVVDKLETDSSVKLYGSGNSDNYLIPVNRATEIVMQGGKEILQ